MATNDSVQVLTGMADAWAVVTTSEASEKVSRWSSELAGLVGAQQRIVFTGGWAAGPSTLMGVLDLQRAEVANCRVVRWLFDPLARHGIGARMVALLGIHLGVTLDDPTTFRADAEVVRAASRADVVLSSATSRIVIEAKIDAAEGVDQGARLEADWPVPTALAFLTVAGGGLPITAADPVRWRPLSWSWIARTASKALEDTEIPADVRGVEARETVTAWTHGVERYLR